MLRAPLALIAASTTLLAVTLAQEAPQPSQQSQATRPFTNRAGSFRIDLPADWRQLGPAELRTLTTTLPSLPHDVTQNVPHLFYAVGPVERWMRKDFDGQYLYVVEQDAEWHLDGDLKARLQQMWSEKGKDDGQTYEILSAERAQLGADANPAVIVERRIRTKAGDAFRSLDLHVPTGGREVTLCLVARDDAFEEQRSQLLARANTLSLARRSRGETKLSDRLWTPLAAGAVVGILFLILYRRSRRPPS
ncbi:MAG: hypothetical protein RLZZ562_2351 [Planctomycetota bacterium]